MQSSRQGWCGQKSEFVDISASGNGDEHVSSSVLVVLEGWERWEREMAESLVRAFENNIRLACRLRSLRGSHSSWLSKVVTEVEFL
jgi:hypothetical protein